MNKSGTIIDVAPVAHSSTRLHAAGPEAGPSAHAKPSSAGYNAPGWNRSYFWKGSPRSAAQTYAGGVSSYDQARVGNERTSTSPLSAFGGLFQVTVGAGLIAIGVPMLILPGPGLLSIAAGTLLVSRGLRKMRFW